MRNCVNTNYTFNNNNIELNVFIYSYGSRICLCRCFRLERTKQENNHYVLLNNTCVNISFYP